MSYFVSFFDAVAKYVFTKTPLWLLAAVGHKGAPRGVRLFPEQAAAHRVLGFVAWLTRAKPYYGLPIAEGQQLLRRMVAAYAAKPPKMARIKEFQITAADGYELTVRLYVPPNAKPGLMVYGHGGGGVYGDLDTAAPPALAYAAGTGRAVMTVGYRLIDKDSNGKVRNVPGPGEVMPALLDFVAAVKFAAEHPKKLGLERTQPLIAAGESFGATLALLSLEFLMQEKAELHQAAREAGVDVQADTDTELTAVLAISPGTDWRPEAAERESYRLFDGYQLSAKEMKMYRDYMLSNGADPANPLLSPLFSHWLPRATRTMVGIGLTGFDVLHDEGAELAATLKQAGVPVTVIDHPDLFHGFLSTTAGRGCRAAIQRHCAWLTAVYEGRPPAPAAENDIRLPGAAIQGGAVSTTGPGTSAVVAAQRVTKPLSPWIFRAPGVGGGRVLGLTPLPPQQERPR